METSSQTLEPLRSQEYQEYLGSKKWWFDEASTEPLIACIVHLILFLLVILISTHTLKHDWIFYLGWLALSVYPGFLVDGLFWAIIFKIIGDDGYRKIVRKTSKYQKYNQLDNKFQPIENELREKIQYYLDSKHEKLISHIRQGFKDKASFSEFHKDLIFNKSFIESSAALSPKFSDLESKFHRVLENRGMWFNEDGLLIIGEEPVIPVVPPKLPKTSKMPKTSLRSWRKTNRQIQKDYGLDWDSIKTESKAAAKKNTVTKDKTIPQSRPNKTPTSKSVADLKDSATGTQQPPPGKLNFVETPPVKPKKSTVARNPIIKASPEQWLKMAEKKISIGRKGELLAMGYEKDRIVDEEGARFLPRLVHLSEEEGDGFGHDIKSVKSNRDIYIEVKTTTGGFWSNLYFSTNELKTMGKYGEDYFLFRIYNFNELENTANIQIFEGADDINFQFEFEPHTYILQPKK